jgi:hypothetical protein
MGGNWLNDDVTYSCCLLLSTSLRLIGVVVELDPLPVHPNVRMIVAVDEYECERCKMEKKEVGSGRRVVMVMLSDSR